MSNVIRVIQTKNNEFKAAYSVWIVYSDGYMQHTTKYTDLFLSAEEAIAAAGKMPERISVPETSKTAAMSKKTLKLYSADKYVYSIKYVNYGAKTLYKKKFTINRFYKDGRRTASKTMYTPWLTSFAECDAFADNMKRKHGITPDNDRLKKNPIFAHSKQVKPDFA